MHVKEKQVKKKKKVILHSDFDQNVFKILKQNHAGVEFLSNNPI